MSLVQLLSDLELLDIIEPWVTQKVKYKFVASILWLKTTQSIPEFDNDLSLNRESWSFQILNDALFSLLCHQVLSKRAFNREHITSCLLYHLNSFRRCVISILMQANPNILKRVYIRKRFSKQDPAEKLVKSQVYR